ncbi:MAG: hypothetical protein DWQ47_10080 [Acidobacteria bacterium]|nr:MAG: hypothetical protein DWQ32_12495 [Acidobacteriota bacterium]REJ98662.1 MAG: hypothetical protein DWQ38_14985 [Acidobacteriota bacterium]REK16682.1 MAG: hypothetical protein DWQ43_00340 [Acidobacteriota bacterium]REK42593.1 MAG: hypothetical protein DWQ47_10080 [Acidobacteriota bacterium]
MRMNIAKFNRLGMASLPAVLFVSAMLFLPSFPTGSSKVQAAQQVDAARLVVQTGHPRRINQAVYSPDGRLIATAGDEGVVVIWDSGTGRALRYLTGHNGSAYRLSFSGDGNDLAVGAGLVEEAKGQGSAVLQTEQPERFDIRVWNVRTGELKRELKGHTAPIVSLFHLPKVRDQIVSASLDGTVRVWGQENKVLFSSNSVEIGEVENEFIPGVEADTLSVVSAALSPDGSALAIRLRGEKGIRVLSVGDGRQIANLRFSKGNEGGGSAYSPNSIGANLTFSPDGKYLASAVSFPNVHREISTDDVAYSLELWNVENLFKGAVAPGSVFHMPTAEPGEDPQGFYGPMAFSPDSRRLAISCGFGKGICSLTRSDSGNWEVGKPLQNCDSGASSVNSLEYSPDGTSLLIAEGEVHSGGRLGGYFGSNLVTIVDLGKVTEANGGTVCRPRSELRAVTNSGSGPTLNVLGNGDALQSGRTVWDLDTGEVSFYGDDVSLVSSPFSDCLIQISNSGALAVRETCNTDDQESTKPDSARDDALEVIETGTGRKIFELPYELVRDTFVEFFETRFVRFSSDDKYVFVASSERVSIFDIANKSVAFTQEIKLQGGRFLVGGENGYYAGTDPLGELFAFYSCESTRLNFESKSCTLFKVDLNDLRLQSVATFGAVEPLLAVLPGGKNAVVATIDPELTGTEYMLVDLSTGATTKLELNADGRIRSVIREIRVAPDGSYVLIGADRWPDLKQIRPDTESGSDPPSQKELDRLLTAAEREASASVGFIDISTAKVEWLTKTESIVSLSISDDSEMFATIAKERRESTLWRSRTGEAFGTIGVDEGFVTNVAFAPGAESLFVRLNDDSTKIVEIDSGKDVCRLFSLTNNNWAVTTPEGFFDGTPDAWRQMIWRFNNNTFDWGEVEIYFNAFYYPGLLQQMMSGSPPKAPDGQELENIDRRQPEVEILTSGGSADGQDANSGRLSTVALEVTDNSEAKRQPNHGNTSGAKDLRLFRNGSLVKVWKGDVFGLGKADGCEQLKPKEGNGPRRALCSVEIPVVAGENRLTSYVFNAQNVKSRDATALLTGRDSLKRKGSLYVLSIGINEYANPDYDLSYAVPDAVELSSAIRKNQIDLGRYEAPEPVLLTNKEATKANILYALERFSKGEDAEAPPGITGELRKRLSKIKIAEPEDAIIVFFSGHGFADMDRFYLMPHDLGVDEEVRTVGDEKLRTLRSHSVSDLELERLIEPVDSGQILLIIDSCNSGQALEAEEKRRGPMNSKGLVQLAYEKGMYIVTASESFQLARETSALGHGLLTYSLLEGLKRQENGGPLNADKDRDGSLFEREWFDYAVDLVPGLQRSRARTRSDKVEVAGEEAAVPQTPRAFYRRESEGNRFLIAANLD